MSYFFRKNFDPTGIRTSDTQLGWGADPRGPPPTLKIKTEIDNSIEKEALQLKKIIEKVIKQSRGRSLTKKPQCNVDIFKQKGKLAES